MAAVDRPVRTCVGCRQRSPKSLLIRLVGRPGTTDVVLDARQTAPGRGAYLHPDPACHELATRRRAIGRALRLEGVDPRQVADVLTTLSPGRPESA